MAKDVELTNITELNGSLISQVPGAAVLVTNVQQWGYAAELAFEIPGIDADPRVIRTRIAVARGAMNIGWLRQDEKSWVSEASAPSLVVQEVNLPIPAGTAGGKLIFSNANNGATVAIIESVEIVT